MHQEVFFPGPTANARFVPAPLVPPFALESYGVLHGTTEIGLEGSNRLQTSGEDGGAPVVAKYGKGKALTY